MEKILTAIIAGMLGGLYLVISPAAAAADPFHASYQALKHIAMQVQTDAEQALFKPFNCYIVLQPWLNDVWAPCLFNEAQGEIQSAEKCLAGVN